jgi:biopolymer transport protein ExbD
MKLTSTIKLRPDFLYLAPLLNVIMLLMIFFLVNSSLVVQGGIAVEQPPSASALRPFERAHVLTVTAGQEPTFYFNKEKIELADLPEKLQEPKNRETSRRVIISADLLVTHGMVVKIQDIIWAAGCQAAIATTLAQ